MTELKYIVPLQSDISGDTLYRLGSEGRKLFVPDVRKEACRSARYKDRSREAHDLWAQKLALSLWRDSEKIWIKVNTKISKAEVLPDFEMRADGWPGTYCYEAEKSRKWGKALYSKLILYMRAMEKDPNMKLRLVFKSSAACAYAQEMFGKEKWTAKERRLSQSGNSTKLVSVTLFELPMNDSRRDCVRFIVKDINAPCKLITRTVPDPVNGKDG